MLAAEFHYTRDYVSQYMDLPNFLAHMEYRAQHPPAGLMLKSLIEAFGNKGEQVKLNYPENLSGVIPEMESDLNKFLKDAGAAGFIVR